MQVQLKMNEDEIREAIRSYLYSIYSISVEKNQLLIEVKSKQNYKSEWEQASIRIDCQIAVEK